jgi:hypothetical protein
VGPDKARSDLSGMRQSSLVADLDELADLVQSTGLRRTAAELRIDPGWLSKQLSMRRDPVIFPALDKGKLTFTQANELLAAPAVARRPLLKRLYRERPTFASLRTWVQGARAEFKQNQRAVSESAAGVPSTDPSDENRFARLYDLLSEIGEPSTVGERDTLGQIPHLARELLGERGPDVPLDDPAIYRFGRLVAKARRAIRTKLQLLLNSPPLRVTDRGQARPS